MPRHAEASLSKRVIKTLNDNPLILLKKREATPGNKGLADIYGSAYGVHVEIEGKISHVEQPKQAWWRQKWAATGAIVGIYSSVASAAALIYEGLRARNIEFDSSYWEKIKEISRS